MFYVNFVFANSNQLLGLALADWSLPSAEDAYTYNAFIAADRRIFTTAHEIGHLLTDAGHETSGYNVELNLMADSFGSTINWIGATKRLNQTQEQRVLSSSRTNDP